MSLHVGDRILEVNGLPVTEQSLNDIENLIRYSDRVLQVSLLYLLKIWLGPQLALLYFAK